MDYQKYKAQVQLLLQILPFVSEEESFALHGGTAINLFYFDMPRLSVDIDLTYLPIEDRDNSLKNIGEALENIQRRIKQIYPQLNVEHIEHTSKLIISSIDALIKIEVNQIKRGCYTVPSLLRLSEKAQREFNTFCEIQVVESGHLFGGKICAALDRQHPRDLFDVYQLLKTKKSQKQLRKDFFSI